MFGTISFIRIEDAPVSLVYMQCRQCKGPVVKRRQTCASSLRCEPSYFSNKKDIRHHSRAENGTSSQCRDMIHASSLTRLLCSGRLLRRGLAAAGVPGCRWRLVRRPEWDPCAAHLVDAELPFQRLAPTPHRRSRIRVVPPPHCHSLEICAA